MNRNMRHLLPSFLVLALLAAGCAPAATPAATPAIPTPEVVKETVVVTTTPLPTPDVSAEPISLRFTVWSGADAHLAMLNGMAEAYKVRQPNVTIQFETIPFAEYSAKVVLQAAGGDPPDAGWILENWALTFLDAGVLADLRPALERPEFDFEDLSKPALELWVEGDAVYGVPFSTSPFIILYNADLFEAVGLETPLELLAKGEWTWDALARAAKEIAEATPSGIYGFESNDAGVYSARVWHTLVPMIRAHGGDAWSAEGTQCLLDSPEAVAGVQFYHDMVFVDRSAVPPGEVGDFFSGNSAITITQLSRVAKLADATFEWDLAPLPEGPAGAAQVIGQAAVAVFNASEHTDIAIDFVAFMTNKENVTTMAQFFPPARISVLESDALLEANPLVNPESMKLAVVDGIRLGRVLPSHVEFPKIDLAARAEFDRLWAPDADVQAVLEGVCEAIAPFMGD